MKKLLSIFIDLKVILLPCLTTICCIEANQLIIGQDNFINTKEQLQDKTLEINVHNLCIDEIKSDILNNDIIKAITSEKLTKNSLKITKIEKETFETLKYNEIYNVTLNLKKENNLTIAFKIKIINANLKKLEQAISKLNKVSNQELLVTMEEYNGIESADSDDVIDQIKKLLVFRNIIKFDKTSWIENGAEEFANRNEINLTEYLTLYKNDNIVKYPNLTEGSIVKVRGKIGCNYEESLFNFTIKLVNSHKNCFENVLLPNFTTFNFDPLKKYNELNDQINEQIIGKITMFKNKPLTNYEIKYYKKINTFYESFSRKHNVTNNFQTGEPVSISIITNYNDSNWEGEIKNIKLKFNKKDLADVKSLTNSSGNDLVIVSWSKLNLYKNLSREINNAREIKGLLLYDYDVKFYDGENNKNELVQENVKEGSVWIEIIAHNKSYNWYGQTSKIKIQIVCEHEC